MCQLLSYCLSQLYTYHPPVAYSVKPKLGLRVSRFCLVSSLHVGLCQQERQGECTAGGGRRDLLLSVGSCELLDFVGVTLTLVYPGRGS